MVILAIHVRTAFLLTPLFHPATHEKHFNRSHKKTRNHIERGFGVWKRKVFYLAIWTESETANLSIIVTCAVLHNIGIELNEEIFLPDAVQYLIDDQININVNDAPGN